ncbi:hypothetical protein PFMC_01176 [Plasmodium falciparum CAMP/Malaysia]|uniref:Uncharacterized protein n=1 Tax=Plasmodium falciparum (isolate Camp / Malaysia) TaxID=5835 RepID=A0A024XCI7_PLAFC|nr:hypothetical protein PFMC_01176 [Plasmodium falciparum CAMP/Malaysia]
MVTRLMIQHIFIVHVLGRHQKKKKFLYSNIYTHLSCKNTTKIYMDVTYVLLKLKDLRDTLKDDEI